LVKIRFSSQGDLEELMDSAAYEKFLEDGE